MSDVPYGTCHCGCGEKTKLALFSDRNRGFAKGEPFKYVRGHANRKPMPDEVRGRSAYCECGCGGTTRIARVTRSEVGQWKGYPLRFINGHNARSLDPAYVEEDCGYETPCWVWQLCRDEDGYGKTSRNGKSVGAHRASYEQHVGPIPEGLQLDHLCRNPACVNPEHLEPVTSRENVIRGAGTTLAPDQAAAIRASSERTGVLARRYGVAPGTVMNIRAGRRWKELVWVGGEEPRLEREDG